MPRSDYYLVINGAKEEIKVSNVQYTVKFTVNKILNFRSFEIICDQDDENQYIYIQYGR